MPRIDLSRAARSVGLALALCLPGASSTEAQGRFSQMRDPEDGAFDASTWLAGAGGFLPTLSPVTEPALGYGGAVVLAFLHRPEGWDVEEARRQFDNRERMTIPSISAAAGMYTSNNSWAAGGGHLGVWGDGRWRYTGGVARTALDLSVATQTPLGEVFLDYQLDGWGLVQSLRYRIADTDLLVGALYNLFQMETRFTGETLPGLNPGPVESAIGAIGLTLAHDSRNNTFTADRGLFVNLEGRRQDTWLGGDFSYWSGKATLLAYHDPAPELVLALRAEASATGEGTPFWAKPSVRLRGVARGRYAADRSGVFEGEARWDFSRRWSLVGFGGTGWTLALRNRGNDVRWVGAGGGGFRYLLARAFGIRGGLDLAYGKDGFAFYVTMGSAWAAF